MLCCAVAVSLLPPASTSSPPSWHRRLHRLVSISFVLTLWVDKVDNFSKVSTSFSQFHVGIDKVDKFDKFSEVLLVLVLLVCLPVPGISWTAEKWQIVKSKSWRACSCLMGFNLADG